MVFPHEVAKHTFLFIDVILQAWLLLHGLISRVLLRLLCLCCLPNIMHFLIISLSPSICFVTPLADFG
jgi:hypothetical protein